MFVYTSPPGETTILKDLRIFARVGAVSSAQVVLVSGPTFVNIIDRSLNAAETAQTQGFIVLQPGDQVLIQANVTDGLAYWLSGAQLEGVAD